MFQQAGRYMEGCWNTCNRSESQNCLSQYGAILIIKALSHMVLDFILRIRGSLGKHTGGLMSIKGRRHLARSLGLHLLWNRSSDSWFATSPWWGSPADGIVVLRWISAMTAYDWIPVSEMCKALCGVTHLLLLNIMHLTFQPGQMSSLGEQHFNLCYDSWNSSLPPIDLSDIMVDHIQWKGARWFLKVVLYRLDLVPLGSVGCCCSLQLIELVGSPHVDDTIAWTWQLLGTKRMIECLLPVYIMHCWQNLYHRVSENRQVCSTG